jgi:hypothetical protein
MKNTIYGVIALFVIGSVCFGVWFSRYQKPVVVPNYAIQDVPVTQIDTPVNDVPYCYAYHQEATTSAPYKVDEFIRIVEKDGKITGIKKGSQSGPDMTNGYTGTLTGTVDGRNMQIDFAYIIEGSRNTERELYTRTDISLIKHRYRLVEGKGILVPDLKYFVHDIVYTSTPCLDGGN